MERVRFDLSDEEYSALVRMSEQELRSVPDQLRHVLRQVLRRRGLLIPEHLAEREVAGATT